MLLNDSGRFCGVFDAWVDAAVLYIWRIVSENHTLYSDPFGRNPYSNHHINYDVIITYQKPFQFRTSPWNFFWISGHPPVGYPGYPNVVQNILYYNKQAVSRLTKFLDRCWLGKDQPGFWGRVILIRSFDWWVFTCRALEDVDVLVVLDFWRSSFRPWPSWLVSRLLGGNMEFGNPGRWGRRRPAEAWWLVPWKRRNPF